MNITTEEMEILKDPIKLRAWNIWLETKRQAKDLGLNIAIALLAPSPRYSVSAIDDRISRLRTIIIPHWQAHTTKPLPWEQKQ